MKQHLHKLTSRSLGAAIIVIVIAASAALGQTTATPAPTPTLKPMPKTALGPGFKRWIDIDAFTLSTRYRYIRANSGTTVANQQQWQTQFRPRFKFDKAGRYSVASMIATGNNFAGGWNNLGPGTGRGQTNLFVKQLYFDAKPNKHIEFLFGGIAVNNGENSEATGYDNDNYITGERIIIRAPKHVWFDEISLTNAFLGDITRPNVFKRLHRLNESNYHQFMVRKQATKHVGFSADYTFASGTDTFREAVRFKLPGKKMLDTILFEAYERTSTPTGYGFDLFGEKALDKRFTVNGGFARLDRRLTLNGDRFPPGKRLHSSLIYKPLPEFWITAVLIQGVGPLLTAATPRTRFDLLFTYNVLESLHRHHIY